MIPYEKMNPETKRVFEVADLFGAGGKLKMQPLQHKS